MENLLNIENINVEYTTKSKSFSEKTIKNVVINDLSLNVQKSEILGLVGESGCGKSTLAKTIVKLVNYKNGKIFFSGKEISKLSPKEEKQYRKDVSMIFQNPYASLNPKMKIKNILLEPLDVHFKDMKKKEKIEKVVEILAQSGLAENSLTRYPDQFSGGQRQRIAIARSLILQPKLVLADEPVSALDVSIQAQILQLLKTLKKRFDLTMIFVSHDLNVVEYLSDKVAVMYQGEIVELGKRDELFDSPKHPYTKQLFKSKIETDLSPNQDVSINKITEISCCGCVYKNFCEYAQKICFSERPKNVYLSNSHYAKCHFI